jgi:hypothetical protein
MQWTFGALSLGEKGPGVKLTTHLQLVLPGAVHPLPHFNGVVVNLVQGQLYFYLLLLLLLLLLHNFPLLLFRQLYNFILLYMISSFLLFLFSYSPARSSCGSSFSSHFLSVSF